MVRLANYGRTWTFRPSAIEAPENANQLRSIVARATKLRVMGSRHSWSEAIVTDATIVSLEKMNRIVRVDREKLLVTVEAGITLHDLIRELEARGLALSNLGSIDRQSLAGAISTGTHGTGIEFRCLASQAESLRFVDAAGVDRELGKGEPDFDAVVVGLGCFGVVYEITLSVVPCFQMHAITDTASFDEVIENLDELVHGFDHFKLWWLVPEDKVIVFKNRRTDLPRNDSDWTRWFKDELLAVIVYRFASRIAEARTQAARPRREQVPRSRSGQAIRARVQEPRGIFDPCTTGAPRDRMGLRLCQREVAVGGISANAPR